MTYDNPQVLKACRHTNLVWTVMLRDAFVLLPGHIANRTASSEASLSKDLLDI